MCSLWVYVFYGFYVGLAKLHCGATPPSVMVLFVCLCMALASPGVPRFFNVQNPSLGRDSFSQAWIFDQFSIGRFKFEATNSISCLTSTPSEVHPQYLILKVQLTAKCVSKFKSKPSHCVLQKINTFDIVPLQKWTFQFVNLETLRSEARGRQVGIFTLTNSQNCNACIDWADIWTPCKISMVESLR